mmetsp:Transcript_5136/g.12806  ORF Transcript_5136/g.12806 Transcript_5136/m.12806 type:complete len:680 (-) Transcript_5136:335-2374(-)
MKIRSLFSKTPKSSSDQPLTKKISTGPPVYHIQEKPLGEGGYGKVYEATINGDPERKVAVKKIPLTRVREDSLHREVRIGRELNHPHIVKVFDSFVQDGEFHMVMELVPGGELFERVIQMGMLGESEAATNLGQLLLAVHHCHSKGVAHRDIKLENILLQASGQLKLIDFGLAALHDVVNGRPVPRVLKDKCGSKSYAAPEVNTGRGYNGFAADVWSCGICLFAMLSGFFPLDEAKESDWRFRRFVRAEAAGLSVCDTIFGFYGRECPFSEEAVGMLESMLRANPFDRLRVDELLANPWLRRNASPRVRALIEVTINPLPLALIHAAAGGSDSSRPHSAPDPASRTVDHTKRAPLTPPPQPTTQSTLQANLERAYAAIAAVVSSRPAQNGAVIPATAGAGGGPLPAVPPARHPVPATGEARDSRKRPPQRTPPGERADETNRTGVPADMSMDALPMTSGAAPMSSTTDATSADVSATRSSAPAAGSRTTAGAQAGGAHMSQTDATCPEQGTGPVYRCPGMGDTKGGRYTISAEPVSAREYVVDAQTTAYAAAHAPSSAVEASQQRRVTRSRMRQANGGDGPTYRGASGLCVSKSTLEAIRREADEADALAAPSAALEAGKPPRRGKVSSRRGTTESDRDSISSFSSISTNSSITSGPTARRRLPALNRQTSMGATMGGE